MIHSLDKCRSVCGLCHLLKLATHQFVIVLAMLVLSSCREATATSASPTLVLPALVIDITGTESTEVSTEILYQPNCEGNTAAEGNIERSRSIEHTIEIPGGTAANMTVNGELRFAGVNVELGNTIASQLGYSYGTTENINRSLTLRAEPGTNMQHTIKQTEVWKAGTAKITVPGQETTVPFRIRDDFVLELAASQDLGCNMIGPTTSPGPPVSLTPIPSFILDFARIDQELKAVLTGSMAYNAPSRMNLGQTTTIELLLNPSVEPTALATQITESGAIVTASIQITPRMKAVLKAQEQHAFEIQSIHDNPEQLISTAETTRWSWFLTAKETGLHQITITIYRLVKFSGQDYWREVESYEADIDVKVTLAQRIEAFDWKWIAGIGITLLLIPAFWRWMDSKKKKDKKTKKTSFE